MSGKADDANGAHRASEPVPKPPDIDAQQGAEYDANGGLVRDDEDLAFVAIIADFLNDFERARGNGNCGFAFGRRIPRRVGRPAKIVVVE